MTTRKKLECMKEMEARNEARRKAYLETVGIHGAIEIHARAVLGSLDILAQHHGLKRAELLEVLVNTMWAMEQHDQQEG